MLNLFVAMLLDAFRVFSLKTEDDDDGEDDKIKKLLSEMKIHMKNFFNEIKLKWSKKMRLFDSNSCTIIRQIIISGCNIRTNIAITVTRKLGTSIKHPKGKAK